MMIQFIVLFAALIAMAPEQQLLTNNDHVSVELHVPSVIPSAQPASISFYMTPVEGIHINSTPVFELRLDKSSSFDVVGAPRFVKDEQEYLDINQPVEFSVKAKQGTSAGKHLLKGTLNYFYCSDKEGWCNRFSQKFEVTVAVKK